MARVPTATKKTVYEALRARSPIEIHGVNAAVKDGGFTIDLAVLVAAMAKSERVKLRAIINYFDA